MGVADSLLGAVLAARHGVVVTGPAADFLAPWPLSAVLTALTTSRVRAEARELFGRMLACRNSLGLLSEDFETDSRELWGNYPQTYSLVGLINCATMLSRPWSSVR